ncbi:MAG: hypothetical protein WCE68_03850 [Anaerolineales bacterium]
MPWYRLAGQDFYFPGPIPELAPFENSALDAAPSPASVPAPLALICQTVGWVAGEQRQVETWSAPPGFRLRVAGGSDFYISPAGQIRLCTGPEQDKASLNETDRLILLGPVLVLALALRSTWCLHASAALFRQALLAFLGESGQGKSTLAGSLAAEDWRRVADDILPVTLEGGDLIAWPRFPQLKLPVQAPAGPGLPERLLIRTICVLTDVPADALPALQLLPVDQAIQAWLSHTAGTRMFGPGLLARHLAFCTQAAGRLPVYRLDYPHRWDALARIKGLLESIC